VSISNSEEALASILWFEIPHPLLHWGWVQRVPSKHR